MTHSQEPDKGTNGGFWTAFFLCLAIMIASLFIAITSDNLFTVLVMLAIAILSYVFFYFGAEKLEPNQIGNFIWLSRFTPKYTKKGGLVFKFPVLQKINRFNTGMFTIEIPYKDLTMLNGDNASGIAQLTLKVNPEYFGILYQITDGSFDQEVIVAKCKKELDDTVPAKLSIAVQALGIEEGYLFEEATKKEGNDESILRYKLLKLLQTHHGGQQDVFGLELLTVQLPTPEINGDGYKAYKATKTSKASVELSKSEAAEFNSFLSEFIKKYKEDTGMAETDTLDKTVYMDLRASAERQFMKTKGAEVKYYDGIGEAKPRVSI